MKRRSVPEPYPGDPETICVNCGHKRAVHVRYPYKQRFACLARRWRRGNHGWCGCDMFREKWGVGV